MAGKEARGMSNTLRKIIGSGIVGIVVAAGAFWWYEWRPHEVRQACLAIVNEQIKTSPLAIENADAIRVYYEMCLHARGLDK